MTKLTAHSEGKVVGILRRWEGMERGRLNVSVSKTNLMVTGMEEPHSGKLPCSYGGEGVRMKSVQYVIGGVVRGGRYCKTYMN